MPEIILHHYPMSPFAQKVRSVLGYKQLQWKSVIIPSIMPKPDLVALTGGYRKTPVLQIGCDVYCDTALICEVLEHLQPLPRIFPDHQKGLVRVLAQWADTTLFWTAMAYNLQPKGAAEVFASATPDAAKAFGADRAAMSAGMQRLKPADATAAYKSYLRRLATMLEGNPFLLGPEPSVADFASYHPLWFTRRMVPSMAAILDATPAVLQWMDRMESFGQGRMEKLLAEEALAISKLSKGATAEVESHFQDEHAIPLGTMVYINAESFGQETTEGELMAATRTRYTLRRSDVRSGEVHVHFPRIGYVLKRLTP